MGSSVELVIESREDFLLARVTGPYDQEFLVGNLPTVVERCKTENHDRILLDFRGVTGMPTLQDLHDMGERTARVFPLGCLVALVANAGRVKHGRYVETVARNRGALLCLFTSIEEAEAWLKESH